MTRRAERERRSSSNAPITALTSIFGTIHTCGSQERPSRLYRVYCVTGQGPGTHIATDHEDTSAGAVHCFQDEFGNWHSYTFGPESSGTATSVNTTNAAANGRILASLLRHQNSQDSSASGAAPGTEHSAVVVPASSSRHRSRSNSVSNSSGLTVILDSPGTTAAGGGGDADDGVGDRSPSGVRRRGASGGGGGLDGGYLAYSGMPAVIRSHRSPLNLFAETLFERRRQTFGQASSSLVGEVSNQGDMNIGEGISSGTAGGMHGKMAFTEQVKYYKR